MAVTAYSQKRFGRSTTVEVTSGLSGTIYYHWYLDGTYLGMTRSAKRGFFLADGEQMRVEVLDTNDANYDPIANAPAGWPARRYLWWVRSPDDDVDYYRVDQKKGAGSWAVIGRLPVISGRWSYSLLTPRLDDLSTYTWQIVPVDTAGNEGTALTKGPELIVRTPDCPDFTATFNSPATTVTFAEAA